MNEYFKWVFGNDSPVWVTIFWEFFFLVIFISIAFLVIGIVITLLLTYATPTGFLYTIISAIVVGIVASTIAYVRRND